MSDTERSPESVLIDHAMAVDYDGLDPALRRHVRDLIFDTLAIGIGAAVGNHASGRITEDYAVSLGGRSEAMLWSGKGAVTAEQAALVNGTLAEILDYQDTVIHPRNAGHLAVTIVPAALAVAEAVGADARLLGSAVAAGIDVGVSVLAAVGTRHRRDGRGFRTTALSGPIGAAVACARLLGLDHHKTLMALGIAAAAAPKGLMTSLGGGTAEFAMDKDLQNGLCAEMGVVAARLAERGMTGASRAVTGDNGFLASHAEGDALPLLPPAPGDSFVRYPCLKGHPACYGALAAVEATLQLRAEGIPPIADIEAVRVHIKDVSAVTLNVYSIPNDMAARFSIPYCVASTLIRGHLQTSDFSEAALADQAVLALMPRVEVVASPELSKVYREEGLFAGEVELIAGNQSWRPRVMDPPGSFANPLGPERLRKKFSEMVDGTWSVERQDALLSAFEDFDGIDVRRLIAPVKLEAEAA